MSALLDLVRNEGADSSIAFRERCYGRVDQADLLRDVIALANASVVGRRFLFIGVDDEPGRARRFPGISERTWMSFCAALPGYVSRTVEPQIKITLQAIEIEDRLVGAVCLDSCEDPPYLLARNVGAGLMAGSGWARRGTRVRPLLRKHLQRIFVSRFRCQEIGDVSVGFPGDLPREELALPVMPLDGLPSAVAADKINRMLAAKRVSKDVLGRSDSHIERLVHTQVSGSSMPYKEQGTKTMRVRLRDLSLEHAAADDHYQYELRAHRLNLLLNNLSDKVQADLVLTLKFPRVDGLNVAERIYPAPGKPGPKSGTYPKVDAGPRTIVVQASGLRIPRRGSVQAFFEPLRLCLREAAAGQTIRVGYALQGPTLAKPVQGRLKIIVSG